MRQIKSGDVYMHGRSLYLKARNGTIRLSDNIKEGGSYISDVDWDTKYPQGCTYMGSLSDVAKRIEDMYNE